ncbi:MAG TPA: sigma-70 family RNA polymerase sigma factor [Planctomycetota bacterium]|nr:sigma-70 family RNA polymerase sigma factor [Planctomycetota bacterium]
MNPARQPPEALFAHREWVRNLARRLVADDATAEDVEQQTWLSAVLSPPRHASAPKAWLATILRNWVHKLRRGEERRARRERAAVPAEPTPSTAEIVAEAEAHQRVVAAVFALAEPFRTTVILRFFENLPLAEVAARTAVPVETAKSRIRRALELLRARLEEGGRRTWALALLPLVKGNALGAPSIAILLEALVMNGKHMVIGLAALLLLGAAAVWTVMQPDPSPAVPVAPAPAVAGGAGPATGAGGAAAENVATARPQQLERQLAEAGVGVVVSVQTWRGTPIEGALVSVAEPRERSAVNEFAPQPPPRAQKTTDASGAVTFPDLPAGVWSFVAGKEGYCGAGRPDVIVDAATRAVPVVIHLGIGYALAGTVTDGEGRAIEGAVVVTYPTSSAMVRPRTETDAQGRFRFDSLAAGPAYVAAALPGGVVSDLETIQIPEIERLDLVLRTGGVLTGRVIERGSSRPIAGASVTASTTRSGSYRSMSASAVTDAQGRYVIRALGEGLIREVTAEKEGYVHLPGVAADNIDSMIPFRDGGTWTRDLEMGRGGTLVVTVRGPGGAIAGARVRTRVPRTREQAPSLTEADGRARLEGVLPGRVLVEVRADGLYQPEFPVDWWSLVNDPSAQNRWLVDARAGQETSVEVPLARAATIAGRVVDPDGRGIEGVRVGPANADARSCVTSGADGSFLFAAWKPGATVSFSLDKDGWIATELPAAKIPESGELRGLELRMRKAPRVHGTVRWSGAQPDDAWVQVSLLPEREEYWQEEFRWANTPRAPIAADGSYDQALPGIAHRFVVRAVATKYTPVVSAPVSIVDGESTYRVDLDFSGGVTVSGRVVVLDGTDAVPNARIRATWLAPGVDAQRIVRGPDPAPAVAVTDRGGSFALAGLRPGRHELRVAADGFLEEAIEVTAPKSDLVIALPPALSIEGHIVYEDGRPVSGAQISPAPQQGNRAMWISIEQMTISGPDGRFKIPRVHPGQFRVRVQPPRTGLANFRACQSEVVAAGARDVRIVVEAGAVISGRVTDASGQGLSRIGVVALKPDSESRVGVETLPDGSFTLIGLEDGAAYTLTVNASNRGSPYASLQRHDVAAGTSGLQFVLERGLSIGGAVADGEGKPVRSLEITASPVGSDDTYGPVGWTDQEGVFEIRGLRPGKYRLAVSQWFSRGVLLTGGDEIEAGATGVRLTATEGAKLAGVVVDEAGQPVAGAEVYANAALPARGNAWTRSGSDGTFLMAGLVPGASYEVSVRQRDRVPANRSGVPAGSSNLRFTLSKGLELEGRLVDSNGHPQAHATLRFAGGSGSRVAARTDADGRFSVSGLGPGTYSVEASVTIGGSVVVKPCGSAEAGQRGIALRLPP